MGNSRLFFQTSIRESRSPAHSPEQSRPWFDVFSWQSFIALNWPASSQGRGSPDRPDDPGAFLNMANGSLVVWGSYKESWELFANLVTYLRVDATVTADFAALTKELEGRENLVRVIFLSMAPSLFTAACANLAAAKVVTPKWMVLLTDAPVVGRCPGREIGCG